MLTSLTTHTSVPLRWLQHKTTFHCYPLTSSDSLILTTPSHEKAAFNTVEVLQHLQRHRLGFNINWQKSSLPPSQLLIHLGAEMNLRPCEQNCH